MGFAGLRGKVAVVTGAGSGIGAGVARRLSEEGANVVVVDRDADRATTVAGDLGGEALAVAADVSVEDGVGAYMDAAVDRFGRIDLYHLNAGIAGTPVPIPEIEAHEFDEVMAVNVRGVFLGLRDAFRQFERQGSGGAIVTTSSLAGVLGAADIVPYHVSKHAVLGLARCGAIHGATRGVRVNAVAPGIVPTNLISQPGGAPVSSDAAHERARVTTPLERAGTVDEVAALVAFLLSDEAAYMTGGFYPVDGGAGAANPFRPLPAEGSRGG
ncbi:MAG: SDR family NAD(P)-dependent oxidoreductase [Verrucomicrobiota bacterium]